MFCYCLHATDDWQYVAMKTAMNPEYKHKNPPCWSDFISVHSCQTVETAFTLAKKKKMTRVYKNLTAD